MSETNLNLILTLEEMSAVRQLSIEKDLSEIAIIRQALRHYQMHEVRIKNGETCTYSGDKQRMKRL